MSSQQVPVAVQSRCCAPPDHAFAVIAPIDLTQIFTGMGPLPAVVGVSGQTGPWDTVGRQRRPQLSDGSTATERLTAYDPPHTFGYEITDFTGPLRHIVEKVSGQWTFTPDGPHCLVHWTYTFHPGPGRGLVVRLVAAPLWRRYARATLARAVALAERC
ncbi:hypothetical protein GCM10023094_36890 [Rhodococcus olei]|uniref:Polyketide cyclase/dehydrase/lipid transport protein n=1 Tax=Rhodococcus olei TaxID=2161675 RepID=A0ABP8PBX8_9NOCA